MNYRITIIFCKKTTLQGIYSVQHLWTEAGCVRKVEKAKHQEDMCLWFFYFRCGGKNSRTTDWKRFWNSWCQDRGKKPAHREQSSARLWHSCVRRPALVSARAETPHDHIGPHVPAFSGPGVHISTKESTKTQNTNKWYLAYSFLNGSPLCARCHVFQQDPSISLENNILCVFVNWKCVVLCYRGRVYGLQGIYTCYYLRPFLRLPPCSELSCIVFVSPRKHLVDGLHLTADVVNVVGFVPHRCRTTAEGVPRLEINTLPWHIIQGKSSRFVTEHN